MTVKQRCAHIRLSVQRVKQSVRMQIPTEDFFTNQFGLPLTMNPSFEDLSCEMIFGQKAPSLQEDPIYSQPCFAHECKIGDRESPRHALKLTQRGEFASRMLHRCFSKSTVSCK